MKTQQAISDDNYKMMEPHWFFPAQEGHPDRQGRIRDRLEAVGNEDQDRHEGEQVPGCPGCSSDADCDAQTGVPGSIPGRHGGR